MKKVVAVIGSQSKNATYNAVQKMESNLMQYVDIEFEYIFLSEFHLEFCQGCKLCFEKGEQYCPLKDDRDKLLEKLDNSDGVIFATPVYGFQVTARMKNFIDRSSYIFHRPCFFSKTYIAVVTQGVFGGRGVLKYLEFVGKRLGFEVIKGSCVRTSEPITDYQQKWIEKEMKKSAERFYKGLIQSKLSTPSFFSLILFRLIRTCLQFEDSCSRDFSYYNEKGWFHSDYYYEAKLGLIKKSAGNLCDRIAYTIRKNW
ncbi:flavodoxin family protein [Candidatus Contubernalis alkaliaceticus]|uniref:flavodoxin family protein n=1 Tax=Candidatus Contubernalis alkaliaceticus TaxID=338645 RepID=UPI001F4BE0C6|nr:flavodoxin family protein [Candidatus Contubernalis alkalaceticus]UNC92165.1 flavodoxin family protein [Candidatus Contubernalis alkalaceticus]